MNNGRRKGTTRQKKSPGVPIRILVTNPSNPEEGRIFLWTKAGWFERIEGQSGDLTFILVAQSEDELRHFVARDDPSVELVQLSPEYRKRASEEFTGLSTTSDLEIYYATQRERKNRLLTTTGISFVSIGLLLFGIGIYFRLTYSPVNFTVDRYLMLYRQVYSAGLGGILVGLIMDILGWIIMGFSNLGKR